MKKVTGRNSEKSSDIEENCSEAEFEQKLPMLIASEQVRLSYSQTSKGVIGGNLAALLFLLASWSVKSHSMLIIWFAVHFSVSMIRVLLYFSYRRLEKQSATHRWKIRFSLWTFIQACVWGVGWWLFITKDSNQAYIMAMGTWMVALSAASFSAYTADLLALFAFYIPTLVPGIIRIMTIGGALELAAGLGMVVYMGVMFTTMLPVHRSMLRSIRLNFDNSYEIRRRREAEKHLKELTNRDGLTGLATRRYFDEVLPIELKRSARSESPISLLMADIDYFKRLNDTYGHLEGDSCLRKVSEIVRETGRRPGDLCARYGGEELAVLLPNTGLDEAGAMARKLCLDVLNAGLIHESTRVENCSVVTVSIGVASFIPTHSTSPEDLIGQADEALYRAKDKGRNRIEIAR